MVKLRKKTSRFFILCMLLFTVVLTCSALGAGYGNWLGTLITNGSVSLGNFDVRFAGCIGADYNLDSNDKLLNIHLNDIAEESSKSIVFLLSNNSSIPAVCEAAISDEPDPSITIDIVKPEGVIYCNSSDATGTITVKVDKGALPKAYNNKFSLVFRQNNGGSWTNTLDVVVHYSIPQALKADIDKKDMNGFPKTVTEDVYSSPDPNLLKVHNSEVK